MFNLKRYVKKLSSPAQSVAGSLRSLDELEILFQLSVDCYCAALESAAEHAPALPRGVRDEHRKRLRQIRNAVKETPDRVSMSNARKQTEQAFSELGRATEKHLASQERDAREVLAIVASLAESIASRDKQANVRFRGIAKKLRMLTTATDLSEIRVHLAEEVGQLERFVEDMTRDTQAALDRVNSDLRMLANQDQAAEPWISEAVDPVTQLAGRPEAIAAMESRLRADARFCVAAFCVAKFEGLRTKYGRQTMDVVLRELGSRLKDNFPDAVSICRWGSAEFLVVIECHLPELASKAAALERRLSGAYTLNANRVILSCFSAAAQALRGERVEELTNRVLASNSEVVAR